VRLELRLRGFQKFPGNKYRRTNAGMIRNTKTARNHRQGRMRHYSELSSPLPNATADLAQESDATGRDIAINVITSAQEDDAVTGWIGLIVFQLVIWNHNSGSNVYMLAA
jgi:hypothetical protein